MSCQLLLSRTLKLCQSDILIDCLDLNTSYYRLVDQGPTSFSIGPSSLDEIAHAYDLGKIKFAYRGSEIKLEINLCGSSCDVDHLSFNLDYKFDNNDLDLCGERSDKSYLEISI